jgi:hypothetical protein
MQNENDSEKAPSRASIAIHGQPKSAASQATGRPFALHLLGIAAELGDIVLDPLQRHPLVVQAVVATLG